MLSRSPAVPSPTSSTVLRYFPDAQAVAAERTVAMIGVHGSPDLRAQMWDQVFPGQIGDTSVLARDSRSGTIDLEDNELRIITSVLHVPSLSL